MKKRLAAAVLLAGLAGSWSWAEGPEEGPPPGPPEAEGSFSPADEEKALGFVKENAPEMAQHLEKAKKENPEGYRQHMHGIVQMSRDPDMRQVFLRNMKSEQRVRKASGALRHGQGGDKEALKKELEAALSEQFDAKLAQQELQLKKMETEIGRLKARIDKRRGLKEKIVKKRVGELSGDDAEAWDW